jgi:hypothetical protein
LGVTLRAAGERIHVFNSVDAGDSFLADLVLVA